MHRVSGPLEDEYQHGDHRSRVLGVQQCSPRDHSQSSDFVSFHWASVLLRYQSSGLGGGSPADQHHLGASSLAYKA